jgi:hypothetical protein
MHLTKLAALPLAALLLAAAAAPAPAQTKSTHKVEIA